MPTNTLFILTHSFPCWESVHAPFREIWRAAVNCVRFTESSDRSTMVNSIAFLIVLAQALLCASQQKSLTSLNHFLKVPADSIQTGGRLAERQLAYIAQNGYKSLFSIVEFATNDTSFNGVDGTFPSTDYEMSLAKGYGMEAKYVVSSMTRESAYEISNIIKGLPQPVYIHCHVSFSAVPVLLDFLD